MKRISYAKLAESIAKEGFSATGISCGKVYYGVECGLSWISVLIEKRLLTGNPKIRLTRWIKENFRDPKGEEIKIGPFEKVFIEYTHSRKDLEMANEILSKKIWRVEF